MLASVIITIAARQQFEELIRIQDYLVLRFRLTLLYRYLGIYKVTASEPTNALLAHWK